VVFVAAIDMALPLPAGLVPSEVAFLCEMELVSVVPRQRLESIELLGVSDSSTLRRVEKRYDMLILDAFSVRVPLLPFVHHKEQTFRYG
jgi:hypothetical protein